MNSHFHKHSQRKENSRTQTMTSNRSNLLFHLLLFLLPTLLQALNTDGVALLSFKYSILSDPLSLLQSWNYDDETPCSWIGVTCTVLGSPSTPDILRVTSLVLPSKQLLGSVSPDLFSIPHLRILDLSNNFFHGSLPDSVSKATELQVLSLGNNKVSGELPSSITNMASLQLLNLSANAFTGKIPPNLPLLKNLKVISLAKNSFSGDIPGGFKTVQVLDISSNLLNGSLPPDFGGTSLHYLNLSHNQLFGVISPTFAEKLPASAILDLSFNNLTGPIPSTPSLINQKTEAFSGNIGLCGQPLKTLCSIPSTLSDPPNISETTSPAIAIVPRNSAPTTPPVESANQTAKSKLKPSMIVGITLADIAGLAIIAMFILYLYQLKKRRSYQEYSTFSVLQKCLNVDDTLSVKKSSHQKPKHNVVTASEVTKSPPAKTGCGSWIIRGLYDETTSASSESDVENQLQDKKTIEAFNRTSGERLKHNNGTQLVTVDAETHLELDNLLKASAYVLGTGRSGIVYKAVLENGEAFAVRRIAAESCTTTRFKEFEKEVQGIAKLRHPNLVRVRFFVWGKEEKLLICDYVLNGSLSLSSVFAKSSQNSHNFEARLKIARGIAGGIAYIHEKKQVHGNIKPNNILLDSKFEPVITDMGLNRLMNPAHSLPALSSQHHPPEWSTNQKPNHKWDVYSFGAILLELLTGKAFSINLVRDSEMDDRSWYLRLVDEMIRVDLGQREDEVVECFKLGFGCVSFLPHMRPSMKEVVQVLDKISV